jgi:mannan endo-1,4-beta-mannosidase
MSTQYGQLIELGKDKKLIAASEVGGALLPDQLIAYEAHWLWFAVWGDTFINNPVYNPIEVLKTVSGTFMSRWISAYLVEVMTDKLEDFQPRICPNAG